MCGEKSYVGTLCTLSSVFRKSRTALKNKVFLKRGWCLRPRRGENSRELSSKGENSLEKAPRCAVGGLAVRVLADGWWQAEKGRRFRDEEASGDGSHGLFSCLPVSEGLTPVVSVSSKELPGKCCWTQCATTSTSWKGTTLASSFPTTKRSR